MEVNGTIESEQLGESRGVVHSSTGWIKTLLGTIQEQSDWIVHVLTNII
jgi:hypothetical protein